VTDLDDAVRLLRQAIFALEHRLEGPSLRQRVLHMSSEMSPVPEITFAGPVDVACPRRRETSCSRCCGRHSG
jgi:hypothetical protein